MRAAWMSLSSVVMVSPTITTWRQSYRGSFREAAREKVANVDIALNRVAETLIEFTDTLTWLVHICSQCLAPVGRKWKKAE